MRRVPVMNWQRLVGRPLCCSVDKWQHIHHKTTCTTMKIAPWLPFADRRWKPQLRSYSLILFSKLFSNHLKCLHKKSMQKRMMLGWCFKQINLVCLSKRKQFIYERTADAFFEWGQMIVHTNCIQLTRLEGSLYAVLGMGLGMLFNVRWAYLRLQLHHGAWSLLG